MFDIKINIMPKNIEKNPKKRIWPLLKSVIFLKISLHSSGEIDGISPSNKNIKPKANIKTSNNYFFSEFRRYLKKSESASNTIISPLLLKLFL